MSSVMRASASYCSTMIGSSLASATASESYVISVSSSSAASAARKPRSLRNCITSFIVRSFSTTIAACF